MPGGQNKGPNPMDLCLGALSTCQDITYKAYVRGADIPRTGRGDAAAATWIFRGDESWPR